MAFVTLTGNIGQHPELRYTNSGQPVCTLSVAESRKFSDASGAEKEQTTWWRVVAWRELAENIADSIKKGDRVIVSGRCEIRSYKDDEGNDKYITEITANDVAPSLRWATCVTSRNEKIGSRQPEPPDFGDEPF